MCFSANASFLAAGAIGVVGVATLRHVREPRTLAFASLPLLFSLHQAMEGLVWLGLEERTGPVTLDHATFLYMLYAYGVLPLFLPIAVALMEPPGLRRRGILLVAAGGAVVFGRHAYAMFVYPSVAEITHHAIAYHNPATGGPSLSALYILVTCSALLLSTHRVIRLFGIVNLGGLTVVQFTSAYAFASIWCFYAAILSIMIYWQFSRGALDGLSLAAGTDGPRARLLPWLRSGVRADLS